MSEGARWSSSQYSLVHLIASLDDSGEWALDGAPSCAHWVAERLDSEVSTAREWLRIGHALARLKTVDEAFAAGKLSYSKVRTLTRVATDATQEQLCELAERVPAGRLAPAIAAWQTRRETPEQTEIRQQGLQSLRVRTDADGMGLVTMRLMPLDTARLTAAVNARVRDREPDASADAPGRWPPLARQRAEAFAEILHDGVGSPTTEVVLHVRGDGCTLDDGTPISSSVVSRIAPEAFIRVLVHDAQGRPVNASSKRRHPTTRQKRVVKERDRCCVDCGSHDLLIYDHVPDYEVSKHTVVDELELRCGPCHHRRHGSGQ